eukprot:TRINITY_DN503_c0_g1_i3.p1 TRINITY_DN503_c0_g1~~TRINITY_DN503_c0_g1_i3.p1  ORF type:complete len:126 (-),score=6.55 TRINITY_DN503_c0_g1_i3:77-454(-)
MKNDQPRDQPAASPLIKPEADCPMTKYQARPPIEQRVINHHHLSLGPSIKQPAAPPAGFTSSIASLSHNYFPLPHLQSVHLHGLQGQPQSPILIAKVQDRTGIELSPPRFTCVLRRQTRGIQWNN